MILVSFPSDNIDVEVGLLSTLGDPGRAEGSSTSLELDSGRDFLNIFLNFSIDMCE